MKALFVAAALLAASAIPALAAADEHGGSVGVGFGATKPISDLKQETDPSWVVQGFGHWQVAGPLAVRVSGAYDRFRPSKEDRDLCAGIGAKCKDRIGRFDGGLELGLPAGKAHPYGFAEIGAYNFQEQFVLGRTKISESSTNLGGGFGGGLRADVGSHWGIGGELPLRWWREKEDGEHKTYWYLEPNGFVYIRFGR